jgi:3-hydroxyacyl-[acyl-carrier-protein] dehydratase
VKNDIKGALLSLQQDSVTDEIIAEYTFAHDLTVFIGHFPQNPILPGIFQLEMARYALEVANRKNYNLISISKAKFMNVVLPDNRITIKIKAADIDCGIKIRAKTYVDQKQTSDITMVMKPVDKDSDHREVLIEHTEKIS